MVPFFVPYTCSVRLAGVNFVFNNSPVKEVGWLKGKLSNEEWVAAVTATHKACKETNKKFTELTCAACDTILDGVRLNVEKAITNLNTQVAQCVVVLEVFGSVLSVCGQGREVLSDCGRPASGRAQGSVLQLEDVAARHDCLIRVLQTAEK
jgi:hypothetical protein